MKRLLILLALAGLGTAVGCGDDEEEKETPAGRDAGVKDAAAPRPVQVTNPGAACVTKAECQGPGADCMTEIMLGMESTPLEGGYCTAVCQTTAECGPNAGCPIKEIAAGLPIMGLDGLLDSFIPANCLAKCDKMAPNCRTGYTCSSFGDQLANLPPAIAGAAGALGNGPAFKQAYCLPPIEIDIPDGGGLGGLGGLGGGRGNLDGGVDAGI